MNMHKKFRPAPVDGGFKMEDYWTWCGSVIQGEDGKYHMFSSRWPKKLRFTPYWLTHSEVVRAVSDSPEGPYTFEEVVLPPRGAHAWDGKMTHNPSVMKIGDTYVLFYTGTTYEGQLTDDIEQDRIVAKEARANQRIGIATAPSVSGPWMRREQPVLFPREDQWDALMTTNPAPCLTPDGEVLLIYKSAAHDKGLLHMGVSKASHYEGPYERLSNAPIFNFDQTGDHVEDGFVWWSSEKQRYEIIMKDMRGGICGEKNAGVSAYSEDGVQWYISDNPLAYSKKIKWSDGTETLQGCLERPQLLFENGRMTHFIAATGNGPGGFMNASETWTVVIPLD